MINYLYLQVLARILSVGNILRDDLGSRIGCPFLLLFLMAKPDVNSFGIFVIQFLHSSLAVAKDYDVRLVGNSVFDTLRVCQLVKRQRVVIIDAN